MMVKDEPNVRIFQVLLGCLYWRVKTNLQSGSCKGEVRGVDGGAVDIAAIINGRFDVHFTGCCGVRVRC